MESLTANCCKCCVEVLSIPAAELYFSAFMFGLYMYRHYWPVSYRLRVSSTFHGCEDNKRKSTLSGTVWRKQYFHWKGRPRFTNSVEETILFRI